METSTMIFLAIGLAIVIFGSYLYFYLKEKKEVNAEASAIQLEAAPIQTPANKQLQLQAYERLVILSERISLPNVISRSNQPGLSKTDMQQLLTAGIKQEFEYNLSQQIYVSNIAWEAIRNLKEQNLMVINQVASFLPMEASGQDLNKALLEVLNKSETNLSALVQDALSFEAKKLM